MFVLLRGLVAWEVGWELGSQVHWCICSREGDIGPREPRRWWSRAGVRIHIGGHSEVGDISSMKLVRIVVFSEKLMLHIPRGSGTL